MLMLMPLQQFCECVSRIWVCGLCECELSVSASALVALMFLLVLSIYKMFSACAWKYVIKNILWHVKASIKRFSSIHMPCLPPTCHTPLLALLRLLPTLALPLRSRFILCPARYSFRFFLGYVSCFPFSILLLCWPFGSSFYGKLHLSMC